MRKKTKSFALTLTTRVRAAMLLIAMLCCATGTWAQSELTVYEDGTDNNSYVPFYGMYADTQGCASECVIPSDQLTEMAGGNITAMTFYIKQAASEAWTGTHQVYIGEVNETTLTGITGPDAFTVVATASFNATGTELTVTFDEPYAYGGGNLLIGTYVSVAGNYKSAYFYGVNQEGNTAWYRSSGSGAGSAIKFLPKTTFTYTGGSGGPTCGKPDALTPNGEPTTTEFSFTIEGGSGLYNIFIKAGDGDWTNWEYEWEETTVNLTNLESNTAYQVRVQSVCTDMTDPETGDAATSSWKTLSFTTPIGFPYSQEFTESLPATWTLYSGLLENIMNNTETLQQATSGWSVGTGNGVLDGNHAYANIYGTSCKKWLVTPAIQLAANAQIAFDVAYTAYSGTPAVAPQQTGDDDKFVVLISTDNKATWTILRQWDNAGSTFVLNNLTPDGEHVAFDLADYAGQSVNVAFYCESTVSNADNNIHIDNVAFQGKAACAKPTGLSVNYTGGLTAEVTWGGEADTYNIDVNGTVTEGVTSPYTLENLELATTYEVKVQAVCDSQHSSEWTNPVSFTTDLCMPEDQCVINFALTDSYGDGWNGAKLQVVDVETGKVIGTATIGTSSSTATSTLSVCIGREVQFQWVSGSYDTECSYVVTDVNDEVIFEGSGAMSEPVNYTVDCTSTPWHKPTNLAASEIGARSAVLSWTENCDPAATAWVMAYKAGDADFTEVNVTENPYTLTGLTPETTYTVKVRPATDEAEKWSDEITFTTDVAFPSPEAVAANNVLATTAEISWTGNDEATSYNLRYCINPNFSEDFENGLGQWTVVRNGEGDGNTDWRVVNSNTIFTNEALPAHSGNYVAMSRSYNGSAVNVDNWLISPQVNLGGTMTYWVRDDSQYHEHYDIYVSTTTTDLSAFTKVYEPGDASGEWTEVTVDLSAYAGQQGYVAFRNTDYDQDFLFIDDVTITAQSNIEWTTVNDVTNPYTIEGLSPETNYSVEVQAVYEGGESTWAPTSFTTLALDAVPFDLQTADVTATTATLNWEGVQDSYNVRYRRDPVYYFNPFNTDEDRAGWSYSSAIYGLDDTVYNIPGSSNFFLAMGWSSTEEEFIVSPELPAYPSGSTLEFYHFYYTEENTFQIGYSTTTANDVDDFTWSDPISSVSAGDAYTAKYSQVLPDGVKYIAFRATASSQTACIFIDDIKIFKGASNNEWEETISNVDATTLTITGLDPETDYEWQVQGNLTNGTTEWSEAATFTTNELLELANDATDNSAIIDANAGKAADVTLAGRTLYKDGKWNTICLPFNVTISGSVLEGAKARSLNDAYIDGTTLNLNFSDEVSTLEAGTPYIIRWTDGDNIVNPVFEGVTIDATDNSFGSGSGDTRVRFLGNFDAKSFTDADNESVLLMGGDNTLRYANAKAGLGACRAYFQIGEEGSVAARVTSFNMNFGSETTGIRSIENEALTKDSNEAWYSLDGRKLNGQPATKGVYIKGNRIIIK